MTFEKARQELVLAFRALVEALRDDNAARAAAASAWVLKAQAELAASAPELASEPVDADGLTAAQAANKAHMARVWRATSLEK